MKVKAVFFDLDGTLLPMDLERFTGAYFRELVKEMAPLGVEPEALVSAVWDGTRAMAKNDGTRSNDAVFWDTFSRVTGVETERARPLADGFYSDGFNRARGAAGENPLARRAVELARRGGRRVVLATNPIFPMTAQLMRLSWVGLGASDFDLITSYEGERFCKPNPEYYLEICRRIGVEPSECLMIGNDEREDMYACSLAGIAGYYVTDCAIPFEGHNWDGERGSFAELVDYLASTDE